MKAHLGLVFLGVVLAAAAAPALGAPIIVTPVGGSDATAGHDWGMGFSPGWWVGAQGDATLYSGYDPYYSAPYYRYWYVPVLEFPVGGMAGRGVRDATLHIYFEGTGGWYGQRIRYCDGDDGDIGAGDWFNAGQHVAGVANGFSGWFAVDVTPYLQQSLDASHAYTVFTVAAADWCSDATIRASEYPGFSPYLEINLPEPASMALLALGGLALLRRRR